MPFCFDLTAIIERDDFTIRFNPHTPIYETISIALAARIYFCPFAHFAEANLFDD